MFKTAKPKEYCHATVVCELLNISYSLTSSFIQCFFSYYIASPVLISSVKLSDLSIVTLKMTT